MFYLVRLDRDADSNLVETPLPDYGTFDKGADAAKASKDAAAMLGAKVQCRRIAQAGDWRAAMQKRVDSGELTPLPAKWTLDPIKDHFAHLWANDSSKIAFIESEDHGIIQKLTVLNPGRYINRFYETDDQKMDDAKRRALIAAIDPSGEIFFATTPDEIVYVYKHGPSSCMDGAHDFDHLDAWPVAPYGAGDLAVAYTKNNRGRIQSRALCWPEKKLFGRCYGDTARLRSALSAEGFTDLRKGGDNKVDTFIGARLLKIPNGDYPHQYIVPYFDDIGVGIDMGDHFVTAPQWEPGKQWVGSSSSGISNLTARCPKLDLSEHVVNMKYVHGADQLWSASAVRQYAFNCSGTGKLWDREYRITLGNGEMWSKEWFEEHGARCAVTDKAWPKADMVQKGDKWVHQHCADDYDDDGNEVKAKPKRRRSPKKFVGVDTGSEDHTVITTAIRGANADTIIIDEMAVLDPTATNVNDLILNRRRRAA